MRISLLVLLLCGFLLACSKKTYLERSNENAALSDAIKQLDKRPDDAAASEAVPILYKNIQDYQLKLIESYRSITDISKWDKLVSAYTTLQSFHDLILATPAASRLVSPVNYQVELLETKQQAAEAYYHYGKDYMQLEGRDNAKKAYQAFKKVKSLMSNYHRIDDEIEAAYEKGMIRLVVNTIRDQSYFIRNGWGNYGANYSKEYFQDKLVRDLSLIEDQPMQVYSDWQAQRDRVDPDWTVDIILREINIPSPQTRTYTRQSNASVENGRDTAGRPIYQTVYATLHITEYSFTARCVMDVDIRDWENRKSINNTSFREEYRWKQQTGRYTGDSRALTNADWAIIHNQNNTNITKEEVLQELFSKLYPRVLNYVKRYTSW
jgi:hypothetical protein